MPTKIMVMVSVADAVRRRELQAGVMDITIDSWEGWTDDEREELAAELVRQDGRPFSASWQIEPSSEGLHTWAMAQAAKTAEKREIMRVEAAKKAELVALIPRLVRARAEAEGVAWLIGCREAFTRDGVSVHAGYSSSSGCAQASLPDDIVEVLRAEEDAKRWEEEVGAAF